MLFLVLHVSVFPQDILVNNDFHDVFKQVQEQLPNIKMKHGGDGLVPKPKAKVHPMIKLQNYIEKNNLRLVDFFNRFDKDGSMSVTREEFKEGIDVSLNKFPSFLYFFFLFLNFRCNNLFFIS